MLVDSARRDAGPEPLAAGHPSAPPAPGAGRDGRIGARVLLGMLAVASGTAAVVVSRVVFPEMSDNNDEAVYRLQADALRHGHLFPPATEPAEAARPWLSVIDGDHYVPKYTPVFGALIAAGRLLTGTDRAALVLVAVASVLSGYWLAREILGSRGQALIAAGVLAASPVFLIQSGTYLSYLLVLALLQGFAAALIRAVRARPDAGGLGRTSRRCFLLAGLLVGVAAFARPYDTVLVALPFSLWWLLRHRRDWRRARPEAAWIARGAALPLAAMLGYFWLATGSPLQSPFNLLHPNDRFGFGRRQMYEGDIITEFTPWRGVIGTARHLELVGFWCFGGFVLVGMAIFGLRKLRGPGLALAAVSATVPLGYTFFWGIWGSTEWGGPRRLGPFYAVTMLIPLAIIGTRGLLRLWRWDRPLGVMAVMAMAVVSLLVVQLAYEQNQPYAAERARLYAPLRELPPGRPVIFLPPIQGQWLGIPFALARNGSLDGRVVWALDRGGDANRLLLRSFPDRSAYRLVAAGERSGPLPNLKFQTRLEPFPRARREFAPP